MGMNTVFKVILNFGQNSGLKAFICFSIKKWKIRQYNDKKEFFVYKNSRYFFIKNYERMHLFEIGGDLPGGQTENIVYHKKMFVIFI